MPQTRPIPEMCQPQNDEFAKCVFQLIRHCLSFESGFSQIREPLIIVATLSPYGSVYKQTSCNQRTTPSGFNDGITAWP